MTEEEVRREILSFLGWAVVKGHCIDFMEDELDDMAAEYAEERSKWNASDEEE